eukprot:229971-Rhodomonas_salina.5
MTRLGLIEHPCPPPSPPLCEEAVSKAAAIVDEEVAAPCPLHVHCAVSGLDHQGASDRSLAMALCRAVLSPLRMIRCWLPRPHTRCPPTKPSPPLPLLAPPVVAMGKLVQASAGKGSGL